MKRVLFVFALLIFLMSLLAGCGGAAERGPMEEVAPSMPVEAPMEVMDATAMTEGAMEQNLASVTSDALVAERKIIYHGSMDLVVEKTDRAAEEIQALAQREGGYVASMNGYRRGDQMVYDITIRVPADAFDATREALHSMAVKVEREQIATDDVTDEYYDLDARLKTLKETEAELTELLRKTEERGGDVEDIMAIYDRLTRIRAEIESLQGQLNRLDKLVAFSTLDIHLEPHILAEPISTGDWSLAEIIHSSINTLMHVLATLLAWFIRFVIVVVPVVLILLLPFAVLVWGIHRWQARKRR